MREVEIQLTSQADCRQIERAIERAIQASGLVVTLRDSLKKCPGCIHWHLKLGREPGTLEVTFWPRERRAWFTIQSGRTAGWIDERVEFLSNAIRQ